jgi:4-amino-4-deoxy-L-arabinose transferase-like glycosyltransferase
MDNASHANVRDRNRLCSSFSFASAAALLAGLALRLWWVYRFGQTTNDTRIYGEFARNLMEFRVYGFNNIVHGVLMTPSPTLIRLPGYPLFLALCFKLFGMENYIAVMLVQVAIDLWSCLLLAGVAARVFGRRTGFAALWLAALCPFTANYVALALTETLTLWCMALAFYALARWREGGAAMNRWLGAIGFALAYAILLRPEQGMLAAAIVPAMLWIGGRRYGVAALRPVLLVSVLTLLPLVPWTIRNWRVFHVFEPLAPRYATDPGDLINYGYQRWYRTWAIDYASTENFYWAYDGSPLQIADLPDRAFDSNAQYAATAALLADYNQTDNPSAALDARFDAIGRERIHADPLRYYLELPVARVINMAFRPRTEFLPIPDEWWKFAKPDKAKDWFALAYAALNIVFYVLAGITIWRRRSWRQHQPLLWAMIASIAMRAALLLTLDNSEDRYTLEFYPVLIVLAAAAVNRFTSSRASL